MMITEPKKECIASIAMYRELVDKGLDIYDILAEFIKYILFDKKIIKFKSQDINKYLKEVFNYSVPDVAVKESIRKIESIKPEGDEYTVISDLKYDAKFLENKERLEKDTEAVFENLISFIELKHKRTLTASERTSVFKELYDFLLKNDSRNHNYTKLISLWIIQNSSDGSVKDVINTINEGILVTTAFEYTPSENKDKTWDKPLTLYFDVENLFSLEGLNGEPYKSLSNDLLELIQNCNKKRKEKLINIKYFGSVKREVESYYNAAFELLRKGRKTFQNKTAMANILASCEYPSDAQEKKTRFFQWLKYRDIIEYDESTYSEEDYKYNIIDNETIIKLKEQFSRYNENELENIQKVLNKINYLRKGQNNSFYNSGHFFVTGTRAMLNIAKHSDILRPESVPLATNVEYLTERIWSKTNASFGSNKPNTVNAVIIAKLILSNRVHVSINEKYEELQKEYKENHLSEDDANEILANLKETRNSLNKINNESAEQIVEFLDSPIDAIIEKKNAILAQVQEKEERISILEREKEESISISEQEKEKINEQLEKFQEEEETKKYQQKKNHIQRLFIPFIIISFIISGISAFIVKLLSSGLPKLMFDILNTLGFMNGIILLSIMFINLRLLEKKRNKDW